MGYCSVNIQFILKVFSGSVNIQFILKVFSGVQLRALCSPVKFFYTKPNIPFRLHFILIVTLDILLPRQGKFICLA